jgi:hypothetical protein
VEVEELEEVQDLEELEALHYKQEDLLVALE